jgi:ketosteroid isomerase-like protein
MSGETVELARRAVEAINETYRTGDAEAWRRFVEEACDPDLVLQAPTEAFTEGEWRGHDGAVGFVVNQMEVLERMWLRADDYVEAGPERLLVAVTFGGRARHTGIDVELHPFHVFTYRNGKATRWQIFTHRDDAVAALEATD